MLPMPREPECNITHTVCSVSRQTSMKWLPPPSVPSCFCGSLGLSCGYFAVMASQRSLERAPAREHRIRRHSPGTLVGAAAHRHRAMRHGALDARAQRRQRLRQIARLERGLHGHHAAADVDADRRRDDRALASRSPSPRSRPCRRARPASPPGASARTACARCSRAASSPARPRARRASTSSRGGRPRRSSFRSVLRSAHRKSPPKRRRP